ncbi:MAG: hypothetical protein LBV71_08320 [Prevotella sp.]|jgi:hypothetical protein|nr:hypothetical protein [Prevotella sp.]
MRSVFLIIILISININAIGEIKFAYCSVDLGSSSSYPNVEYVGGSYVVSKLKDKNTHISYVVKSDGKQKIINKFLEKGWELDYQDGNILGFRINL